MNSDDTIQVRCCCDPGKLLGYVPIPSSETPKRVSVGTSFSFVIEPARLVQASIFGQPSVQHAKVLTLEIARWSADRYDIASGQVTREGGIALRSDDTPIETLRRIPGWREAEQTQP